MERLFRNIGQFVLYFHIPLLILIFITTIFMGYAVKHLKIDPSTETLLAKNSPAYQFYREFRKHFGSDSLIAIAIKPPDDYLTLENMRATRVLTETLSSDARVDRVISLTNAMEIRHKAFGVKVEPLIRGVLEDKKSVEEFRREVLSNPLVLGNLISKDGAVGAILIRLKPSDDNPNFLKGYVSEIRDYLDSFPWPGTQFYVAGSPVEQHDFVDAIRRDQMFFVPAVSLFLILAIFAIYRNWASVFAAMSIVFVTLIWTFGTIALTGRSLNLVNSLLGPIVMIISVTEAIHLINLYSELRPHHSDLKECIALTLEHLGIPCLLASGTTVAGFFSLLLNPVPAVRSFGVFAGIGTLYAFFLTLFLTPALLPFLPCKRRTTDAEKDSRLFNQMVVFFLEKIELNFKGPLLAGAVLLTAFSFYGMGKIHVDTNLIDDLPGRAPLAVATRFIDENLAGVYSLGLSLKRRDRQPLVTVETLKRMDEFIAFLEKQPEITKANALTLLIKKVHQAREGEPAAFRIPEDEDTLETYLEKMAEADNPDFWSFISRDFSQLRIEARMRAVGTQKGAELEHRIWTYLRNHWGPEYEWQITGNAVLMGHMSASLVTNQIQSLWTAFLAILAMIVIFFRSFRMGLLAAVPNLLPIFWLYGFIGFMGIELSTPIAMISNVALGLVVDASIHFLYRFRREFEIRKNYLQALHHTYRNVGQALIVSTGILIFGFATSIFAGLKPTVYFGVLTSLTIFFALVCTLLILPLILVMLKPLGPSKLFKNKGGKETLTPKGRSSILSS